MNFKCRTRLGACRENSIKRRRLSALRTFEVRESRRQRRFANLGGNAGVNYSSLVSGSSLCKGRFCFVEETPVTKTIASVNRNLKIEAYAMAREPMLILICSSYSKDVTDIIKLFNEIGWVFKNEKMEYLPLNDDGMYCWQEEPLSYEKLFSIIRQKQKDGENIGVILYQKNSDKGTTFLAKNTDEIILCLDINRKVIEGDFSEIPWGGDYTDISWYIINIVAELEKAGCVLEKIEYEEIIG